MAKYKFLLTLLFTVIAQTMLAQSKVISGTVEDAMGPIMMANVVERDANNRIVSATQTDMMGNFSMEIKNPKNKLVFSYVGNKTKIVNIGNQTTFNIKMESENTTVSEVVVKGRRTSSGGLNIDKREISVSQQTFSMVRWMVWPSPRPMRPCKVRLPVWISLITLVTSVPVHPCVCVVCRP